MTLATRPGLTRFLRTVASHSNDPTRVPAPPPTSSHDDALVLLQRGALHGVVLLDRPYAKRRRKLEKLAARGLPDGLVLTPATTDAAVARTWMLGHTHTGIEGVVAKRLNQPYRPGRRAWQKLRTRVTAEAIIGGITGRVEAPQDLVLGRYQQGQLRIAGPVSRGGRRPVGTRASGGLG